MRKWLAAVGVVAAVVVVGGGLAATAASGKAAKSGGVLRIGTSSRIDSMNPFVAFNQDAYSTFEYVYPFLVQYNGKLQFAPDFATSWTTSKDGLTWTFKTRANAKWSDGQPLTASDAAWTINTDVKYQGGAAANAAGLVAHVKRADAPTPTTLVVHYSAPVGNVLGQFQQLAILPQHVWSRYTANGGKNLKTYPNESDFVAGGPFTLTKYKKNDIALFERNDNFYGSKPQIDGFGLQMFSNDDALVTAMKSKAIDVIESVPPTAITTLKHAGVVVSQSPGVTENDFIINSNPKKPKNRELLNLTLREAFAHAIDRTQIAKVAWLGTAKPATTIIPPATGPWHNPGPKVEAFNLSLANKLLDGLGYAKGSDGIRTADGHRMSYTVIIPSDLTGVDRTFQIIQSDFRKIGVELKQRSLDSSAAFDAITAPGTKYLNFDLAMWDWVPLVDPDFMLSVLTCAQYGGWSDTGYCNSAYDKLYAQQGVTRNVAKRRAIVWQMQSMLFRQRPYIMLNYQDWVMAQSPSWIGLQRSLQGPFNSLSKQSLTQVHQK